MNKKLIGKLLIVILLISIVITNVSYAVNIDKELFKKSLRHLYASDIKSATESTSEGFSGSSTTTYHAPSELEITDDKILLREKGEVDGEAKEFTMEINYSVDNNIAKYSMETDIQDYLDIAQDENAAMALFGLIFAHSSSMTVSYLTIADYLNIDLNTAASYYDQCAYKEQLKNAGTGSTDEDSDEYNETITCDLFTRNLYYNSTTGIIKSSIEVNIDEVEKINSSLLDGTVKTTIEFVNEYKENGSDNNENVNNEVNNTVNNTTNNTTNNTVNNTADNTVNNTANNAVNSTNTNTNTTNNTANNTSYNVVLNYTNTNKTNNTGNNTIIIRDNTTTNKVIPAAGESSVYCFLVALTVASIYTYIKLKQYDDVK